MIASPLFKVPVPISPPYDMQSLPEDISLRRYHDFSLEHRIVTEYQRIMAEEAAVMEAKENAYRLYAEERQERLRQERISRARKIAPGFLDNEDRRILTPTLATAKVKDHTAASQDSATKSGANHFDYSEFETNDNMAEETERHSKEEVDHEELYQHPQQSDSQHALGASVNEMNDGTTDIEGTEEEEEVIVQAVPLSELTGMLRDSCLEEESSSSAPRTWTTERDVAAEKSALPAFSATRLDYREFEQGLGPPDPWDTPVDDLTALRDVISQQMGHTSSQPSGSTMGIGIGGRSQLAQPQPSAQAQQSTQKQQQPQAYSYPHQPSTQPYQQQPQDHQSVHGQFQYGTNTPTRTGYSSSPIPVASYVPPPKPTGIAQQQQLLQQHQQQYHRHSTGAMGTHPATGLTSGQQHARFGNASPSPPPLPPPPRGATASPTASGPSSGPATNAAPITVPGVNRPPLPARPYRPTDDSPSSSSLEQTTTVVDRSMTPPRPPPPPPPPTLSSVHVAGEGSSSSSAAAASQSPTIGSSSGGGPPALRPRPPKDHEMLHGVLEPKKTSSTPGGFVDMDQDQQQQQQQVAPAPPQANSLIDQLVNMGFTREQSRGALEKYDYDLEKATNHLLDWDD
ncbi:hypothetical protein BGX28_008161 [Mortierella sp. GBA30]|nr:hypothetical protein BGX28_008161 [Mortierella sp. GBA30]